MSKIYKIVQNIDTPFEYEYAHDYTSISDCLDTISEYEKEDKEQQKHGLYYDIIDTETGDIVNIENIYKRYAVSCMVDIGLTVDEALIALE